VGAGDAIGAAVARRFSKGGDTVCAHWAMHEQRRKAYQKAVAANVPLNVDHSGTGKSLKTDRRSREQASA
jgi:NAD(P)-dependent dehydrogenase (short-subunit alcohol dehydrogenase family)